MTEYSMPRTSGILLHPTSLPSPYGIGDLGKTAYEFIDFLKASGQHLWQVLPLTHTGYGDSPYQSFSAFAGQPLLISPDYMHELGLLTQEELSACAALMEDNSGHIDYGSLIPVKTKLLKTAYERFTLTGPSRLLQSFHHFCTENDWWLSDYALFMACKDANDGESWLYWKDCYRLPTAAFKKQLEVDLKDAIGFYQFIQFLFFEEWYALKAYANNNGIRIIGDIPIFVSMDSADVWANPHLFQLDKDGFPIVVAGVPPDYFSETGQLWGNPLYEWPAHQEEHFAWWISRIQNQLKALDILRIDHFRGFESYWAVPFGEKTAVNGSWIQSPGEDLFRAVAQSLGGNLPIIAEDLGVITPAVNALRDQFGFPGMKVLQFAFETTGESDFLPHQFKSPHCVCYTGTHDNDTTAGWFSTLRSECRQKTQRYLNADPDGISMSFIRACLSSSASYALFPLQDVLCIGSDGRMNIPGVPSGNWSWRYRKGDLTDILANSLKELSELYGRY